MSYLCLALPQMIMKHMIFVNIKNCVQYALSSSRTNACLQKFEQDGNDIGICNIDIGICNCVFA